MRATPSRNGTPWHNVTEAALLTRKVGGEPGPAPHGGEGQPYLGQQGSNGVADQRYGPVLVQTHPAVASVCQTPNVARCRSSHYRYVMSYLPTHHRGTCHCCFTLVHGQGTCLLQGSSSTKVGTSPPFLHTAAYPAKAATGSHGRTAAYPAETQGRHVTSHGGSPGKALRGRPSLSRPLTRRTRWTSRNVRVRTAAYPAGSKDVG